MPGRAGMRLLRGAIGSGICIRIYRVNPNVVGAVNLEGEVLVDDEQIGGQRRHARASRDTTEEQQVRVGNTYIYLSIEGEVLVDDE